MFTWRKEDPSTMKILEGAIILAPYVFCIQFIHVKGFTCP